MNQQPSDRNADSETHPSELDLRKFVAGKLAETRITEMEKHLSNCALCCSLVEDISVADSRVANSLSQVLRKAWANDTADPHESFDAKIADTHSGSGSVETKGAPRHFHRFRLIRELGHGGFGIVWLATDPRLKREVALKIPRNGAFINREQKSRFVREASAAAALRHPNVVKVHEAGEFEGILFIATEFCSGNDLAKWLETTSALPSPTLAARIVEQLASAIGHAHDNGVLHRDLKPANVLLDPTESNQSMDGDPGEFRFVPKVSDFGLAKLLRVEHDETATNAIMGSPAWMSPEQAAGRPAAAASDIYSLGAILFWLLTGRAPHVGDSELDTLQLVKDQAAARPGRFRKGLPHDLDVICLKCMEHQTGSRYSSAIELQSDLQRFLAGKPVQARRTVAAERFVRWCRRKPWIAAVWTLLLLTAGGSILFSAMLARQRDVIAEQLIENSRADRQTKVALYESRLQQVRLGRLGTHAGRRFDGLVAASEASVLLNELQLGKDRKLALRNETIGCLSLFDLKVDGNWTARQSAGDSTGIAPGPDGDAFASWTSDGRIEIRRFADHSLIQTIDNIDVNVSGGDDWKLELKFSPDGRFLASAGAPNVMNFRVWDIQTGNRIALEFPVSGYPNHHRFDFRHDGKQIAVWHSKDSIRIYSLPDGKQLHRIGLKEQKGALRYSPFDHRLAAVSKEVVVIDSNSGEELFREAFVRNERWADRVSQPCLAWHPDGEHLSVADFREIQRIPVGGSTDKQVQRRVVADHQLDIVGVDFDPTGQFLATSSWDSSTCLWNVDDNQMLMKVPGTAIGFSRQTDFLTFGLTGPEYGRWEISNGNERRVIREASKINAIRLTLDGRLLIVATDSNVSTWDTNNGQLLGRANPGPVSSLLTSPENDYLLLCGPNGMFRSSVEIAGNDIIDIRLSPPQFVPAGPEPPYRVSLSGDGQRLAVSCNDDNLIKILDSNTFEQIAPAVVVGQPHFHSLDVTGRYLAFSRYHGYACQVLECKSGKTLASFDSRMAFNCFSPDGRWLVVGDDKQFLIVATEDWSVKKRIPRKQGTVSAPAAFSADNKLAAISVGFNQIQLCETNGWTELATLRTPVDSRITHLDLSDDGDWLAAGSQDHTVTLWNLRKIRDGLHQLSIDWQAAPYPSRSPYQTASEILIHTGGN